MRQLLLANADVAAQNRDGETPWDLAPRGSPTGFCLQEELAWRAFLQQGRPCRLTTVRPFFTQFTSLLCCTCVPCVTLPCSQAASEPPSLRSLTHGSFCVTFFHPCIGGASFIACWFAGGKP